jgi:hypothetical protein
MNGINPLLSKFTLVICIGTGDRCSFMSYCCYRLLGEKSILFRNLSQAFTRPNSDKPMLLRNFSD